MKKTIGILSVALLSMVIFTNKSLNENDTTLKNIITIAQAQSEGGDSNTWPGFSVTSCSIFKKCHLIWRCGPTCTEIKASYYTNKCECNQ